jgi:hypothetical protein
MLCRVGETVLKVDTVSIKNSSSSFFVHDLLDSADCRLYFWKVGCCK